MQNYVDQMFNLGGVAVTTLSPMSSGTTSNLSGSYAPKRKGTLVDLIIMVTPQAATSLAQSGYITLNCPIWSGLNTLTIPFAGFGLATAPQLLGGALETVPWRGLSLPVDPANPIIGNVTYAYSPVTPYITVTGQFTC